MNKQEQFTLTPEEFAKLGGGEPPAGYVPDRLRFVEAPSERGVQFHATRGTVPLVQLDCMTNWQDVAERLGLEVMSIRWPDPFYPDFYARRKA